MITENAVGGIKKLSTAGRLPAFQCEGLTVTNYQT